VVGLEKPSVVFNNGRYYASQVDKFLRTAMGHPNVECFYLDPMVNLKQSHLAKNMLKRMQAAGKTENRSNYIENRDSKDKYALWARAVGRHPELTFGASWVQKRLLSPMWNAKINPGADIDEYDPDGEPMLIAQLKLGNAVARNYVKGLYNIRSDEKFFNFLNANALKEQNTLLKLKEIYSTQYNLGD
jgi:hypothetical protein